MQTSLYVFGGRINQQATNELWLFDSQTFCWTLLPSLGDSPLAVAGHTATLVNSKMIVLFGYGPLRGYTDKVQEYNLGIKIYSVIGFPAKFEEGGEKSLRGSNRFDQKVHTCGDRHGKLPCFH